MKETNREYLERIGVTDIDEMMEYSEGERCEVCNREVEKNLSPTNPACEGGWCEEALEYWLDEEHREC